MDVFHLGKGTENNLKIHIQLKSSGFMTAYSIPVLYLKDNIKYFEKGTKVSHS